KMEEKKASLTAKYEPEEAIEMFFSPVQINPNKIILDLELPQLIAEGRLLAQDIRMHVLARNKVCIIGPNGAGKTTLLKLIRQKLSERTDIKVGYLPQNYREVLNDDISASTFLNPEGLKDRQSLVNSYLGALKFTSEEMTHPISELSEGQKCKLLLMKLIVENCEVLILDEPSRNLSPLSNPQLRQMLSEYSGCIIAVSHDRKFINEVCDSIYLLENQQLKKL
ncbi:MAG: ABC-F family ATP-binding cassette domain-containing protein, partial [Lachnospiraceae bacterium]|nr:ABC-F family ATP-binding cassette domain-containing protein [Lachnospiraceae bacterium]